MWISKVQCRWWVFEWSFELVEHCDLLHPPWWDKLNYLSICSRSDKQEIHLLPPPHSLARSRTGRVSQARLGEGSIQLQKFRCATLSQYSYRFIQVLYFVLIFNYNSIQGTFNASISYAFALYLLNLKLHIFVKPSYKNVRISNFVRFRILVKISDVSF